MSFILIPAAKKLNGSAVNFFTPMALLFHNANVLFMVFEMLSNRIPLELSHLPFMLMYGMAYSAFAWYWHWLRGVYYYFFMDYERADAIYWYVGLMAGFSVFYLLSHEISVFIHKGYAGIVPHVVSKYFVVYNMLPYDFAYRKILIFILDELYVVLLPCLTLSHYMQFM